MEMYKDHFVNLKSMLFGVRNFVPGDFFFLSEIFLARTFREITTTGRFSFLMANNRISSFLFALFCCCCFWLAVGLCPGVA